MGMGRITKVTSTRMNRNRNLDEDVKPRPRQGAKEHCATPVTGSIIPVAALRDEKVKQPSSLCRRSWEIRG